MINEDQYDPEDLIKLSDLLEAAKNQRSTAICTDNTYRDKVNTNSTQLTNKNSELRSQIYSLVRKFVQDIEIEAKDKPDLINKIANKVTSYLIIRNRKISKNYQSYKNLEMDATKKAMADLKKVIKNFAVYALYKIMNPRRIAGETKADNFVHNAALRGIESARHYSGGSDLEMKSYSPSLIKNINQKHNSIKKGTLTI